MAPLMETDNSVETRMPRTDAHFVYLRSNLSRFFTGILVVCSFLLPKAILTCGNLLSVITLIAKVKMQLIYGAD